MSVARVAAWDTNNFQDPTGTMTPEAGSNRILVCLQISELEGGFSTSVFTVGGQTFDIHHKVLGEPTGVLNDQQIDYYVWKEAKIAAMSGASVSYTDDGTQAGTMFTYATFTGVDQSTPTIFTSAFSESTDALAVVTTSGANDLIVVASSRSVLTRDITNWDTLSEIFDTGTSNWRQSMGEGGGGDSSTLVTGDGTADDMTLGALVIKELVSATGMMGAMMHRGFQNG